MYMLCLFQSKQKDEWLFLLLKNFVSRLLDVYLFLFQVLSGRVVTVESTPARLMGGPLADTDIALKKLPIRGGALQRVKAVKTVDEPKKSIPT